MNNAEKQKAYYKRQIEKGLVKRSFYCRPADVKKIRDFIESLGVTEKELLLLAEDSQPRHFKLTPGKVELPPKEPD